MRNIRLGITLLYPLYILDWISNARTKAPYLVAYRLKEARFVQLNRIYSLVLHRLV